MVKIAVTGINGLLGSRLNERYGDAFELLGISTSTGINILDKALLFEKLQEFNPDVILHTAAKTNVDGCEQDKELDEKKLQNFDLTSWLQYDFKSLDTSEWENNSSAFAINVAGTKNIVDFGKKYNKKVVYFSTDFVFDGVKDFYTESDQPNPINWYGMTKFLGEKVIQEITDDFLIVRIAYPYGNSLSTRVDFVRKIYSLLKEGKSLPLVSDHYFMPTYIDDIINGLKILLDKNEKGIVHIVGSSLESPYSIAHTLVEKFSLDYSLISETKREKYFKSKAPRPFQLKLKNDRLEKIKFKTKSFKTGLELMNF